LAIVEAALAMSNILHAPAHSPIVHLAEHISNSRGGLPSPWQSQQIAFLKALSYHQENCMAVKDKFPVA
jgi:hypothetical protein